MEVIPTVDPNAVIKKVQAQTNTAKNKVNKPVGTQGTTGTQSSNTQQQTGQTDQEPIGNNTSQNNQTVDFQRGQEIQLPIDKNNPTKTAAFKIKSIMGNEVEIENPQRKGTEPTTIKYNKDQLTSMMSGKNV